MDTNWKIFVSFLRKEGVLEQFKYNVKQDVELPDKRNQKEKIIFIKSHRYKHYLISSFTWRLTREGEDFWVAIDKKWRHLISELEELFEKE
jgi:hypothetical protein